VNENEKMLNTLNNSGLADAGSRPVRDAYALALHHSARVRRLKILLPIAAVVISFVFIGVSLIRAYLPDNITIESAKIENGKVVMEKPAISGRNGDGISYSMAALRALQDIRNPAMITLETIKAAVPVNDKIIARVAAAEGVYNRDSDRLEMTKPFTITLNTGLEAKFESAHLDIKAGKMSSDAPVSIHYKQASILAQRLDMSDKGRIITFEGNVRVNVDPSTIRNQGN